MKKYVIIGNGTAAVGCIEGIRTVDKKGEITVISAEKRAAYCRPLISYLLQGKTDAKRMQYRSENFYEANACKVIYGKSAVELNEKSEKIILDDGTSVDYDAVCVAAGSSPFVPPMDGLDSVTKKHSFMTLDDALEIDTAVNKDSHVLIIGAGLIGLKCAEGLCGKVKSITVCDISERVLSSILDDECAAQVQKHLENNGISFLLGNSAEKFNDNIATMKDGQNVNFDVLITAVGVRPNISLIKNIGGACGRAITVDNNMKTSVQGVYAAGDCTESVDVSSGKVKIMALMPNAYIQGHCAGVNMAGGTEVFDNAIPMNSIGFFGLHVMTAGSRIDSGNVYEELSDGQIKKLYVFNGKLTGYTLVGNTERAGIYTDLIRSCVPVTSVNFEQMKKEPVLLAFDKMQRNKKLGGAV